MDIIQELSQELSLQQAIALVVKIHERDSKTSVSKRFGMYPIEDWDSFQRMKKLEAAYWQADEVDFTQDKNDFDALTSDERKPLIRAFGFFAVGDGSIASMLAYQMILRADTFEKEAFYTVQLNNERIHGETYGKMIYTLIQDPKERESVFESVERVPSVKAMNDYIESCFLSSELKDVYIGMAAAEYLLFTPLFCIIFWYRVYKPGKLKSVIFSNELIAKDEACHCENGCANYVRLPEDQKYDIKELHDIIAKVVTLVHGFCDELFSDITLEGLTSEKTKAYVQYVADDLLWRVDAPALYKTANPYPWMKFTSLIPKTNFYEGQVGEYSRFNVASSLGIEEDDGLF